MNNNVRGLAGAAVGVFAGYVAGAINNPRPRPYREPEPICGCKHHRSFHDNKGCHAVSVNRVLQERQEAQVESEEVSGYSKTLVPSKERYEAVETTCGCKKYVGPLSAADFDGD